MPAHRVRSYRTFSPLPDESGGYFLRHSLYPGKPEPHPLDGVVLCVVRTFLIPYSMRSEERRVGKSVDLGGRRIIKKKNKTKKKKKNNKNNNKNNNSLDRYTYTRNSTANVTNVYVYTA